MPQLLDVAYEREIGAPARARRQAAAEIGSLGVRAREDVILVVSELVTNAVLHGHGRVRMRITVGEECVRVEVEDDESAMGLPSSQSRGLDIVASLSNSCGMRSHGRGKTVWAEVGF